MSSSLKKSLTFFTVSSGVAISSAYFLFPQTVAQRLIQKKYEILTTSPSNDHYWKEILKSYKEANFSKRNLKFANFNPSGNDDDDEIRKLQKICKDLIGKYVSKNDKDNYRRAAKWCVVPVTAREILRKRGIRALEETGSDFEWQAKIMQYRINKNPRKKDQKLDSEILNKYGIDGSKIQALKKRCKEVGSIFNYQHPSHHARDIFEAWCSAI